MSRLPAPVRNLLPVLGLAVALAVGWAIGAQSDHGMEHGGGEPAKEDSAVEQGFLEAMVPHHESGVEMAEMALEHSQSPEIKKLAQAIVGVQKREIEQMGRIHERMFDGPLDPDMHAHDALGLTMEEAGMDHDEESMRELERAKPFDRMFVDMMVPHHQGAIEMSEVLLERTDDAELKKLGQAIMEAQEREIAQMNEFRKREYGG